MRYCTYRLGSRSRVLYAPYLYLSLIYCLTHVECLSFFTAANIVVAAPKLQTTSAVQAMTTASVSFILQKRGRVSRSRHWRNHQILSKFAASFRSDLLARCLRKSATRFSTRFAAG